MAALSISSNFSAFFLITIFFYGTSSAGSTSSFSFPQFAKDLKFESRVAFYGDSKVVNGGSAVQLTSSGRVIYKKPIKLVEGKPQKLVSFSTNFSFSLSQGDGNGLAFVMLPSDFDVNKFYNGSFGHVPMGLEKGKFKIVKVKFSTVNDVKNNGLVKIHAGIDVDGLVPTKVRNASTIDLALNNGKKSYAWVDYEAGSKRLEVRLSQSGYVKPSDPLFWYPIDLSRMWGNEEALVGFFSFSNSSSSQSCLIYSWSFLQRHVPQWMHSEPLDPKAFGENSKPVKGEKRKDCFTKVLASLIFGVACGALMAFTVLYLWTIFGTKRPVVPEEYVGKPVDFEYEKVKVVVDNKTIEDGKQ
ncbi:putative inactive L-type lectin-domain containing receptor kinase III.1 [Morus notabilis]|uniref:Putative inactive L-type lectin-domain containing receptor kinase III.1 n=1 Tax=Morus notabilis TaxID=981085 RepID=W9S5L3_9ROSA|nr:L-type lectin-domain containing receptor kinase VIII.1 [Morus notabilis]EXB89976.1 putative inactive L-type lectin-domain containing receptor kinase III.1 [Morus notabilis]